MEGLGWLRSHGAVDRDHQQAQNQHMANHLINDPISVCVCLTIVQIKRGARSIDVASQPCLVGPQSNEPSCNHQRRVGYATPGMGPSESHLLEHVMRSLRSRYSKKTRKRVAVRCSINMEPVFLRG